MCDLVPNHNPDIEAWYVCFWIEDWERCGDNLHFEIFPVVAWRTELDGTVSPVSYERPGGDSGMTLVHDRRRNTWTICDETVLYSAEDMLDYLYELADSRRRLFMEHHLEAVK